MFDIGFTELLLVALVGLLVLGPERLPGAVRTTGLWIGRAKRSFSNIKAEVEREIGADEIRRQLHNEHILELEKEMKQSILPPNPNPGSASSNPPSASASVGNPPASQPPAAEAAPAQAAVEQPPEPGKPIDAPPASRPDRSPEP